MQKHSKSLLKKKYIESFFMGHFIYVAIKTKARATRLIMREKEDFYLNKYFVSRGTL